MTGGHRPHRRAMADVVHTQMRLHKAEKEGKIPEGIVGKVDIHTSQSCRPLFMRFDEF